MKRETREHPTPERELSPRTARLPTLTPGATAPAATRRRSSTGTVPMPTAALTPARLAAKPWGRPPNPRAPHPLMESAYWLCADLLGLAAQLGLGTLKPASTDLRKHIEQLVRALPERARPFGVRQEDAEEMQYPLVALFDELLVGTDWPGRAEWYRAPLQLAFFRDNTAGENFFRRADALAAAPHRAHVLLIYHYCLALGFRGRYHGLDAAHFQQVYDAIGTALEPHLEPSAPLSPRGEPTDAGRKILKREAPVVKIAAGITLVAITVFAALRGHLELQTSRASGRMHTYATNSTHATHATRATERH